MGRPGAAQRLKKAEKAKVKLKGHTTKFLPKGKNVTDTTFKVRKIVLQDQLTAPDTSQPLTKKKQSIKEILTRLQHYSSVQRQEGLSGLRELLNQMDVHNISAHLSSIVDNLARLALDTERDVRRSSAQILTSLLAHISEVQLSPFSSLLSSYLSCAMTHIQPGVQEDSLLLLDSLLEHAPSLVAASAHRLLPCTLDMISRLRNETQPNRQLSVNLGSSLSTLAWRARVFGRLQSMLLVSLQYRRKGHIKDSATWKPQNIVNQTCQTGQPCATQVDATKGGNFPVYNTHNAAAVSLVDVFHGKSLQSGDQELLDNETKLRSFAESLIPLLLDSWVEISPYSSKESKHKSEDSGLPLESAIILHCVVEIICLLWEHLCVLERRNASHELTTWFKKKYHSDFMRFLAVGFPFTALVQDNCDSEDEKSQGRGRKRTRTQAKSSEIATLLQLVSVTLSEDQNDQNDGQAIVNCVVQNLGLCYILTTVMETPSPSLTGKIFDFLNSCLNHWDSIYVPWMNHLLRAVNSVLVHKPESVAVDPLVTAVVQRYNRSVHKQSGTHKQIVQKLGELLGNIALQPNLIKSESMYTWISDLPASICREPASVQKLKIINHLACQNNENFLRGLQSACPEILRKLGSISEKSDNVPQLEQGLTSLLFWVPMWNGDLVSTAEEELMSGRYSPSVARKVIEILSLRKNDCPALEDAPWCNTTNSVISVV